MAKNYSVNITNSSLKQLPREIVIKRIIAFSKSYNKQQKESELLKILKKCQGVSCISRPRLSPDAHPKVLQKTDRIRQNSYRNQ